MSVSHTLCLEVCRSAHRCDKLCNELSAVPAWRCIDCNAFQAALAVPGCVCNEELLCMY